MALAPCLCFSFLSSQLHASKHLLHADLCNLEVAKGLKERRCCILHGETLYDGMLTSCAPQEWDSEDEEEDLGMAARTLLRSIPRHRLKALESLEADAKEVNAAVKVVVVQSADDLAPSS